MGRSRRRPQTQQFPAASSSSTTMFPTKRHMISSSIYPLEKTSAPISAYSKTAPHSRDSQSDNGMQAKAMKKRRRTTAAAAAHSHKLSNKRRRDKFNKRMRALQNLIPNCTKMDKESVLDEAIYYLKSLQLQLQIMPTFAGLCVPPTQHPSFYQLFEAVGWIWNQTSDATTTAVTEDAQSRTVFT